MKIKNILGLTILLISIFVLSVFAIADESAAETTSLSGKLILDELLIDGVDMKLGSDRERTAHVDRGEEIEIEMTLENTDNVDVEDVTMRVYIWYDDDEEGIEDTMKLDIKANGGVENVVARLTLPDDLDLEVPEATLFIDLFQENQKMELFNNEGKALDGTFKIVVSPKEDHMIKIKDIMLHPESRVMAGDLLTVQVRLENIGEFDSVEDDIKVIARIPGLDNAMDSTWLLSELKYDEDASTEPLTFEVDPCTKAGEYTVEVEVKFDDGDESETEERTITVVESDLDLCKEEAQAKETAVNVISGMQVLTESQRVATFPVVISNNADTSKAFVISTEALGDWASEVKAQETSVVVEAGKTKTVLVLATAREDAPSGKQLVSIKVKDSEGKVVKEEAAELSIASAAKQKVSFRRVLEIGLIVLVILLVLLGLIIGFNKLREDEEDLEEEDKSYY